MLRHVVSVMCVRYSPQFLSRRAGQQQGIAEQSKHGSTMSVSSTSVAAQVEEARRTVAALKAENKRLQEEKKRLQEEKKRLQGDAAKRVVMWGGGGLFLLVLFCFAWWETFPYSVLSPTFELFA
eukprot:Rhum_TRINITY_DN11880_c0_g1::Rhum_TRINITY_DN11880_c0_g1_i1::g.47574::m.47574